MLIALIGDSIWCCTMGGEHAFNESLEDSLLRQGYIFRRHLSEVSFGKASVSSYYLIVDHALANIMLL